MNRSLFNFEGMMAPTLSPFNEDGSLNLDLIPDYCQYLFNEGIKGLFVNGTSGEGMSMTVEERKLLTEAWQNAAVERNLQVLAMVGAGCLKDSISLATHAAKCGVAGVVALPPLYDKPQTVDDLVEYCKEIADSVPDTPFLYYHVPFKTGVQLSMPEFLEKGSQVIPTLCGLKFTHDDVSDEGLKCLKFQNGKFIIFSGFDQRLAECLQLGYKSAINVSFNFIPKQMKKIFDICHKEEAEESDTLWKARASKQQKKVNEILEIIFSFSNGFSIGSLKMAMKILTGIDCGPPRMPNKPLKPETELQMKGKLEQ